MARAKPRAVDLELAIQDIRAETTTREVRWTVRGEDLRAHSEHGTHHAGEIVMTEHADILIERGLAEPV